MEVRRFFRETASAWKGMDREPWHQGAQSCCRYVPSLSKRSFLVEVVEHHVEAREARQFNERMSALPEY